MEEQKEKKQGHKGKGQKYKSLLVWDILQKRTDETHAIQLKEIKEHLKLYGITAERHSIKRDIDDILILLNKELDIDLDKEGLEDRALLGYEVEYGAEVKEGAEKPQPIMYQEEEGVLFVTKLTPQNSKELEKRK